MLMVVVLPRPVLAPRTLARFRRFLFAGAAHMIARITNNKIILCMVYPFSPRDLRGGRLSFFLRFLGDHFVKLPELLVV